MADATFVTLWFGETRVGRIDNPDLHQGTWFGDFESEMEPVGGPIVPRLEEFISFCRDWNRRCEADPVNAPDAAEFDRFLDVIDSGLWAIQYASEGKRRILHAPNFAGDMEVSWVEG